MSAKVGPRASAYALEGDEGKDEPERPSSLEQLSSFYARLDERSMYGESGVQIRPVPAAEKAAPTASYRRVDRAFYQFDTIIAERQAQVLLIVLSVFVAIAVTGTLFWWLGSGELRSAYELMDDEEKSNPLEAMWIAWTWMADPGTHGDVEGGVQRAFAVPHSTDDILAARRGGVRVCAFTRLVSSLHVHVTATARAGGRSIYGARSGRSPRRRAPGRGRCASR